jgi:uncharacterized RDD family membrane protein YckC
VSVSNPYAQPLGTLRDAPVEGVELADRGTRLVAAILDGVIAGIMIYLPALLLMIVNGTFDQPQGDVDFEMLAVPIFLCVMGFIAWAWITALLVARFGQTMAKRMLEIKVVRTDGTPASLGRIFLLRNVVNWLLGIIPLYALIDVLFIFGERRQCIHDRLADTIVIKA